MTPQDFSQNRNQRMSLWIWLISAMIAAAAPFTTVHALNIRRAEAQAEIDAWALHGAPCPTISAAQYTAVARSMPAITDFGRARFERRVGHVQCAMRPESYEHLKALRPVCQFTGPGYVRVVSPTGEEAFFAPGWGRPVGVAAPRHASPQCVYIRRFAM